MKRILAFLFVAILPTVPAVAEPVVVEIFASQNCAKCPRAFRNVRSIAKTEDILPLTWSVDYWDYLAEADPMAMPESTERQNAYIERFELRGPYTPQIVFDGALQCSGTKKDQIEHWIERRKDADKTDISFASGDGYVTVSGGMTLPRDILLVHYLSDYGGDMPNPVVKMETLGQWSGGEHTFQVSCDSGCALLVQEPGTGVILGSSILP